MSDVNERIARVQALSNRPQKKLEEVAAATNIPCPVCAEQVSYASESDDHPYQWRWEIHDWFNENGIADDVKHLIFCAVCGWFETILAATPGELMQGKFKTDILGGARYYPDELDLDAMPTPMGQRR